MVVACSDGRLQEPLDEFLNVELGIAYYDRLYLPGGPGVLSFAAGHYVRASRMADELQFLIEAHQIEDLILVYHCSGEDGPDEAICADYRRNYLSFDARKIREQQEIDTSEIVRGPLRSFPTDRIQAYRLEVNAKLAIDVKRIK
jgi:hypothetical protein